MKQCVIAGLTCLVVTGCMQFREDHVAVPLAELNVLQACVAAADTRELLSNQQYQYVQTLQALEESLAMQARVLEQQGEHLDRLALAQCRPGSDDQESGGTGRGTGRVANEYADKLVVGEIENVLLSELGLILPSRVDTGATTSSLDARNIEPFERNGEDWVRFTMTDPESGESLEVERRRARRVRIVQATGDEGETRPVVDMRISIGNLTQVSEFTLADRSHLDYPMLLGRNVLRDVMIVDVSSQNLVPVVLNRNDGRDEETVEVDERDEVPLPENDGGDP